LAIIEASLAQQARREGHDERFYIHFARFQEHTSEGLQCSPVAPANWFFRFAADEASGSLSQQSWAALGASYRLGPFEAWLMMVRNPLLQRLYANAPAEIREKAVGEFRLLVRDGLTRDAARSLMSATRDRQIALAGSLDAMDPRMVRKLESALAEIGWSGPPLGIGNRR
jgi:hypothetical protein